MTTPTRTPSSDDRSARRGPNVPLADKVVEFNKQLVSSTRDAASSVVRVAGSGAGTVLDRSRTAGKTVFGQARSAVDRTVGSARTGVSEVSGQAKAQGTAVADTISEESHRAADRAVGAVDGLPGPGTPYEEWTREQLYERAQQLDVEGRSGMSKAKLIDALRSA